MLYAGKVTSRVSNLFARAFDPFSRFFSRNFEPARISTAERKKKMFQRTIATPARLGSRLEYLRGSPWKRIFPSSFAGSVNDLRAALIFDHFSSFQRYLGTIRRAISIVKRRTLRVGLRSLTEKRIIIRRESRVSAISNSGCCSTNNIAVLLLRSAIY